MAKRTSAPVEEPVAERQARITAWFTQHAAEARHVTGPVPTSAESLHLRLPNDGTRAAVIAAAAVAGVSIRSWAAAALRYAIEHQTELKLGPSRAELAAERAQQRAAARERDRESNWERERIQLVVRMREKGLTDDEIAEVLGIDSASLCHFLKRRGLQRGRDIAEHIRKAVELVRSGAHVKLAAKECSTSPSVVRRWLAKMDVNG